MSGFDYHDLDPVIHSRIRLAVMAILASVDDAAFTYLRDAVNTTDGNLGTHLARLSAAGYVEGSAVPRDGGAAAGRRPTRFQLTQEGRTAFRDYLSRIDDMLGPIER